MLWKMLRQELTRQKVQACRLWELEMQLDMELRIRKSRALENF